MHASKSQFVIEIQDFEVPFKVQMFVWSKNANLQGIRKL